MFHSFGLLHSDTKAGDGQSVVSPDVNFPSFTRNKSLKKQFYKMRVQKFKTVAVNISRSLLVITQPFRWISRLGKYCNAKSTVMFSVYTMNFFTYLTDVLHSNYKYTVGQRNFTT